MGPSNMYFSSVSPTVVLTPQNVPEPFANDGPSSTPQRFNNQAPFGHASDPAFAQWRAATQQQQQQRQPEPPIAPQSHGRKRSCDEMASSEAEEVAAAATMRSEPQPEPIYGEGMTLIQPSGLLIDASSGTGTWAEEKAEAERQQAASAASEAVEYQPEHLQSRKSQRVGSPHDQDLSSSPLLQSTIIPSKLPAAEPLVDDSTLLLGVGWTRLDASSPHMGEAIRGWARYIDNHYPLTNPTLLLQSKAHNSYLVGAQEGFFLFSDSLSEGRLVGTTEEKMLVNLRNVPILFEGGESLKPVGTPGAMTALTMEDGKDVNRESMMIDALPSSAVVTAVGNTNGVGQGISMQLD